MTLVLSNFNAPGCPGRGMTPTVRTVVRFGLRVVGGNTDGGGGVTGMSSRPCVAILRNMGVRG